MIKKQISVSIFGMIQTIKKRPLRKRRLRPRPREVTQASWDRLRKLVYEKIDEEGYEYIDGGAFKSGARHTSMRHIFNIPDHIPDVQIKTWVEEDRKKKGGT